MKTYLVAQQIASGDRSVTDIITGFESCSDLISIKPLYTGGDLRVEIESCLTTDFFEENGVAKNYKIVGDGREIRMDILTIDEIEAAKARRMNTTIKGRF